MILIDEKLPADPLRSEVILHVRRHLRRALRTGRGTPADLALLFGLSSIEAEELDLRRALQSASPIDTAAEIIASSEGGNSPIVTLGHNDKHVNQCHEWLRCRKDGERAFNKIVATDLEMLLVLSKALDYATGRTPEGVEGTDIPILIEGETGTGKELVANAIHEIWAREQGKNSGFHAVQVAGLPPDLINDELFGHVKGAFTGADVARAGRLEQAHGGTLLIDEIGDLPPAGQVRLLRFLQEQKLSRTGENTERQVRVRILAATWHQLEDDVAKGHFRRDLLHRIRIGWLRLPALRDRPGMFTDVVPELLRRMGQTATPPITRSAAEALALYPWPGNLRELVGILRVALSSAAQSTVRLEDLPPHLQRPYLKQPLHARAPGFLCDLADGQEMSDALAEWRVKEVSRSLETIPPPEGASDVSALRNFLASIPDASEEHQAMVKLLGRSVELTREQGRLANLEKNWQKIQSAPALPQLIANALAAEHEQIALRRRATDREVEQLSAETHLKDSPWFRLLAELRQQPMFANQDPMPLLQNFVPLLQLGAMVVPGLIDMFKGVAAEGSVLEQIRQRLLEGGKQLLEAGDTVQEDGTSVESDDAQRIELPEKLGDYTPDHWKAVMGHFASKTSASRRLEKDVKTISSHIRRHGLDEHWTGAVK